MIKKCVTLLGNAVGNSYSFITKNTIRIGFLEESSILVQL